VEIIPQQTQGRTVLEQHGPVNALTDNNTTTNNLSSHTTANETNSDYPQQPIAGGNYASGASTAQPPTRGQHYYQHWTIVGVSGTQNNDGTNDVTNTLDTHTTVTDSVTNRGSVITGCHKQHGLHENNRRYNRVLLTQN
jgi:hypothetical protein